MIAHTMLVDFEGISMLIELEVDQVGSKNNTHYSLLVRPWDHFLSLLWKSLLFFFAALGFRKHSNSMRLENGSTWLAFSRPLLLSHASLFILKTAMVNRR